MTPGNGPAAWQGWAELAAAITELASVAGPLEIVDPIVHEIPGLTLLEDWLVGEQYLMTGEKHQSLFPGRRCVQLVFLGPIEVGEAVGDSLILFYEPGNGAFTLYVGNGDTSVRSEGGGDTARIERWAESLRDFTSERERGH